VTDPRPKPIADFAASPTSGKVPLKVQFTDKSTGFTNFMEIELWRWKIFNSKESCKHIQ